jgi:hypothetical protein
MSKQAYCHALELRIGKPADQLAALKQRSEHAVFATLGIFEDWRSASRSLKLGSANSRNRRMVHGDFGLWEARVRRSVAATEIFVPQWPSRLGWR